MNQRATTPSDYELAQAVARGAVASIGDLYERHRPKVYSVCLRMTGNTSEAEDLTQEIFIQLLGKAGSFRGESQFSTWLYRFTINHVLMYFRKLTRRNQRFPCIVDQVEVTSGLKVTLGPQLLDRVAIDTAVAKLPSGCRSVFLKFDVEGYNHEEIAGMIGCSVGNSKSQLHKARRKLRKLLSPGLPRFAKPPVGTQI
ncbi:MAG TPA: RNA polymerase sigma factor [Pyrinomonadaceae bacterium]|nr:RNA polymerase sigma factor [Pyrinomonadaceae bacterium]